MFAGVAEGHVPSIGSGDIPICRSGQTTGGQNTLGRVVTTNELVKPSHVRCAVSRKRALVIEVNSDTIRAAHHAIVNIPFDGKLPG